MNEETKCKEKSPYDLIPSHMMTSLRLYVDEGQRVGGFLMALLSNDLAKTMYRADDVNIDLIFLYIQYLTWKCPYASYGSPQKVEDWIITKSKQHKNSKE